MRLGLPLILAAVLAPALARADEEQATVRNAPKLVLRTSTGIFTNRGSRKTKTATSFGGFNIGMHYFLTPALSAGLFYKADFDLIRGTLPFKGFDVSGRWYPFGQGTYTSRRSGGTLLEFHENYAVYVGADFSERTYFLASDGTSNTSNLPSSTDVLEGGYAAANGGVGIDIRMSRHFEMNFEVMTTMFSFSGTDKTVKISSTMFNTGINYVW